LTRTISDVEMTERNSTEEAVECLKDRLDQIETKISEQMSVFENHVIRVAKYMELASRAHAIDQKGKLIRHEPENKFYNLDENSEIMENWVNEQDFVHKSQASFLREEVNFCWELHTQIHEQFSVFRTMIANPNISIDEKNHCQELLESCVIELRNLWNNAKYCQDYLRWEKKRAFEEGFQESTTAEETSMMNEIVHYHVANFELLVELWLKGNALDSLSRISVFEHKLDELQLLLGSTYRLIAQSTSVMLHSHLQNLHRSQLQGTTRMCKSNLFL